MRTVKDIIDDRAREHPDRVFLHAAETGETLTYAQLQEQSRQLELFFDQTGVKPGETVGFLMDNGLYTTCLFLGVMYSGRIVLPLNAVAGPDQIDYVIDHSGLKVLFCASSYEEKFHSVLDTEGSRYHLICTSEDSGFKRLDSPASDTINAGKNSIVEDDVALLIYTSGTTGRPKGVLLSHKNVIAGGRNTVAAHQLTETDRGLCVLPLYHINAEMVSVMAPLVSGGCVVMSRKLSISNFWTWILDYQCSWFSAVPTIFAYLIEQRQRDDEASESAIDFPRIARQVRFGRSASAALSPATHQVFEELFQLPIIETMGISECAAQILSNPMQKPEDVYGSPGLPVGNEVRIVDTEHNPVADHIIGELAVRGDNVMQGYLKNPEATREALDDNGWFYTGDLGYRDKDGYYFVTGRSKELIIRGGENIAPREIDDVLYRHPGILEAAAFGIPHSLYGQEVTACVSLKPDVACTEEVLLNHCRQMLGEVKSPKRIYIIDELPKGPSGKIQRLKLAEQRFPD
ncbi:MAG: AMP-binding protein [Pseudomonadota bacterium]